MTSTLWVSSTYVILADLIEQYKLLLEIRLNISVIKWLLQLNLIQAHRVILFGFTHLLYDPKWNYQNNKSIINICLINTCFKQNH